MARACALAEMPAARHRATAAASARGRLRDEEEAADVHGEQLVPLLLGRVERVVVGPEARVVHEDV